MRLHLTLKTTGICGRQTIMDLENGYGNGNNCLHFDPGYIKHTGNRWRWRLLVASYSPLVQSCYDVWNGTQEMKILFMRKTSVRNNNNQEELEIFTCCCQHLKSQMTETRLAT